jgi:NAD-dependent deacetylase
VLFGEALPEATLRAAQTAAKRASLFLVLGSSLLVSPANRLPQAAVQRGAPLVIINRDPTPLDRIARLVINESIGETLRAADRLL